MVNEDVKGKSALQKASCGWMWSRFEHDAQHIYNICDSLSDSKLLKL